MSELQGVRWLYFTTRGCKLANRCGKVENLLPCGSMYLVDNLPQQ